MNCDKKGYSLAEVPTINAPNSQIHITIPREDSVISLLNSYVDLVFEVIKKADYYRYGDGNDKRVNILGPIALFSNCKFMASSGKHLEDISLAHIVLLM